MLPRLVCFLCMWVSPIKLAKEPLNWRPYNKTFWTAHLFRAGPEPNALPIRDDQFMVDDEDGDAFSWFQGIGWIMRVGSKGKILAVGGWINETFRIIVQEGDKGFKLAFPCSEPHCLTRRTLVRLERKRGRDFGTEMNLCGMGGDVEVGKWTKQVQ